MIVDATFWVAISFFIFIALLIYLKVPQKINISLSNQINEIKKELNEAEKLKVEAKNLLSNYENKIDKSKKETQTIINNAKKISDKNILEKTKKFHQMIEERKKSTEQKISQMKENALKDIKNASIKISIKAVEHLIKNTIDKIDGVTLPVYPSAASMMVIDISKHKASPQEVQDKLLYEHDIFVRAGNYVSKRFGDNFIRVSFSIPTDEIKRFIKAFPKVMKELS